MLGPRLGRVALAGLLCAVASGASPERMTATRPALKKQVALESGLPATRLAQKGDGSKVAVVTSQHPAATRPGLNMQAARESGVPATRLAAKRDDDTKLDDVMTLGGGGTEVEVVATVTNEKARLPCTLITLHFSTYVNRRPLV